MLEQIRYRGAVPELGAVETWFFKRPGAERAGSSKNQFFPLLIKFFLKMFLIIIMEVLLEKIIRNVLIQIGNICFPFSDKTTS